MSFTPAVFNTAYFDESRFNVYTQSLQIYHEQTMTRKIRCEGSADPSTGKLTVTYLEATITGRVCPMAPQEERELPPGYADRGLSIVETVDGLTSQDHLIVNSVEYLIHPPIEYWIGESFAYRSAVIERLAVT